MQIVLEAKVIIPNQLTDFRKNSMLKYKVFNKLDDSEIIISYTGLGCKCSVNKSIDIVKLVRCGNPKFSSN